MKRCGLRRVLQAAILMAFVAGDLAILAPPAEAQVPLVNAGIGLSRVISAINRRNRTYQAARDTQRDFNSYYDSLQDTARGQLISGELTSLRQGEQGLETVRIAAYVRMVRALEAEQTAVTRAIDAETNQARRDFNRTLVRQLQEVAIRLPGAQQILGEVRAVISNVRTTVIALQTAAASNQPLDVLTQRLAEQVSSSTIVQDRVRELGSMLGPDLDRALGGALTQVNNTITDVNREANQAVELLDGMDAQVATLDLSQSETPQAGERIGPLGIRVTDRAAAALDVASQAMAFLTAMQGTGGTTREQMYQQIRHELLVAHNTHLLQAAQNVSQVECREVDRDVYEAAMGALNESPQTDGVTGSPTYHVCFDRDTAEPVGAWIGRVTLPTETPDRTPRASATEPPSEERWTLQQADAASYITFSAQVNESLQQPDAESACYGTVTYTNSLQEIVVGECEAYDTLLDEGPRVIRRIALHGIDTEEFYVGWHFALGELQREYYTIRCVAYRNSDAEGYPIPGRWISQAYPEDGSLLEFGPHRHHDSESLCPVSGAERNRVSRFPDTSAAMRVEQLARQGCGGQDIQGGHPGHLARPVTATACLVHPRRRRDGGFPLSRRTRHNSTCGRRPRPGCGDPVKTPPEMLARSTAPLLV